MIITKHIEIDAAHQLPLHSGKCSRPHGHTYLIDVEIEGTLITEGSSTGMVMDYTHISKIVKKYDHQDLNKEFPEEYLPTTAENFVRLLIDELKTFAGENVQRITVKVCETRSSSAMDSWVR